MSPFGFVTAAPQSATASSVHAAGEGHTLDPDQQGGEGGGGGRSGKRRGAEEAPPPPPHPPNKSFAGCL